MSKKYCIDIVNIPLIISKLKENKLPLNQMLKLCKISYKDFKNLLKLKYNYIHQYLVPPKKNFDYGNVLCQISKLFKVSILDLLFITSCKTS